MQAIKAGKEWAEERDWTPYYDWLERRLFHPGRWAVIPDSPGAPSQINDGLLNEWPFGQKGAPLWHMDGPLDRLGRLCDRFDRVCIGWIGDPKKEPVGCPAYHAKMDEVAAFLGNRWPPIHMMRGILVARMYPFDSADSTSLAQNGWKYDLPLMPAPERYAGRNAYADRLEAGSFPRRVLSRVSRDRGENGGHMAHRILDITVTELLTSLGYGDGMRVFINHVRNYHADGSASGE